MEERLFAEIEGRLQEKLTALCKQEQEEEKKLCAGAEERLQAALERLQTNHRQNVSRWREQQLRQVQRTLQQERWEAEKGCVKQLLADIRKELGQRPCEPEQFRHWFEAARVLLPEAEGLRLEVRPEWAEAVRMSLPEDVQITPRSMLGGAIVIDSNHGRMVDGSWDRRLEEFKPDVWMRWRRDVGADR